MPYRLRHSSVLGHHALKRLFSLQEFSFAKYASQVQLYAGDDERDCLEAIMEIAKRQSACATEIGNLLSTRRVFLQRTGFPMCLTGLNYLSAGYAARKMLVKQPELIAAIRECLVQLDGDHEGEVLARRTLVNEEENLRHVKRVLGETTDEAANMKLAA